MAPLAPPGYAYDYRLPISRVLSSRKPTMLLNLFIERYGFTIHKQIGFLLETAFSATNV